MTFESDSKIEVTAWQGYALGAGLGSKAAAANLSKRGTNWFSNFFRTGRQSYTAGGGNGAAMRIQPHVWGAIGTESELTLQVFRDAIVTHGHPHGFCGAVFHALCLWNTFASRKVTPLEQARDIVLQLERLVDIVGNDPELGQFWLPSWERETGTSFPAAIRKFQDDALRDAQIAMATIVAGNEQSYIHLLNKIGCLTERYRGSGFKTALAALALSNVSADWPIEDALILSANELQSDTDTIATMVGAIRGAVSSSAPEWSIQDRPYLEAEAQRLAKISLGQNQNTFSYPDVSSWEPPATQSDAVVQYEHGFALVGLGSLIPISREYQSGPAVWQWFELPFGQTILAKRRLENMPQVGRDQLPSKSRIASRSPVRAEANARQDSFSFDQPNASAEIRTPSRDVETPNGEASFPGLDRATDLVIAAGFDDATIGRLLKQCIDETGSIELAAAFSAIIAKARIARMRRR